MQPKLQLLTLNINGTFVVADSRAHVNLFLGRIMNEEKYIIES